MSQNDLVNFACPGREPHPPEISSGLNTYNPPIKDPDYLSRDQLFSLR